MTKNASTLAAFKTRHVRVHQKFMGSPLDPYMRTIIYATSPRGERLEFIDCSLARSCALKINDVLMPYDTQEAERQFEARMGMPVDEILEVDSYLRDCERDPIRFES